MPKLALGNHTRFGNVRTRSKTRRVLLRVGYFFTLLAAALIYTRVFPDQQQKATAHDFRRLATNADFDFDKDDCTNKTIQDKYKTEVSPSLGSRPPPPLPARAPVEPAYLALASHVPPRRCTAGQVSPGATGGRAAPLRSPVH